MGGAAACNGSSNDFAEPKASRRWTTVYADLGKARLSALVVTTTALGYAMWYRLLGHYSVNQVMPFLLLLPVTSRR